MEWKPGDKVWWLAGNGCPGVPAVLLELGPTGQWKMQRPASEHVWWGSRTLLSRRFESELERAVYEATQVD